MKKIFYTIVPFLVFFACKKDNIGTPYIIEKDKQIECSGKVFDFETGEPLEGVELILNQFIKNSKPIGLNVVTTTDSKGSYKFTFTSKVSTPTWLIPYKDDYLEFNGFYSCSFCGNIITPLSSNEYSVTDSFYLAKAGKLNLNFKLGTTLLNDTLFVKSHQFYKGKKIGGNIYSSYNHRNNTLASDDFKTLANRMTYLSWKLKSETFWHQDSIFTPYNKMVNFNIKYE